MEAGFVGLGKMGQPMVQRLLAAGHTVHVFNRSPEATASAAAAGARPAQSVGQVADRSEVVLTALPTPTSVDDVYGELLVAAEPRHVFVDHSTIRPDQNRRWAAAFEAVGAAYLDAPVSGGPAGASSGTLTMMIGGDHGTLQRVRPVLGCFASSIHHCGPVGAGQVVKLVNQLLVGVHTCAIAEATVFGSKLGADPRMLFEILSTSYGSSAMMVRNMPRYIGRDFSGATPIELILKDLRLIHDEAADARVPLSLGALAEQAFVEATGLGLGKEDMAAIVKLWEGAAGVAVQEPES